MVKFISDFEDNFINPQTGEIRLSSLPKLPRFYTYMGNRFGKGIPSPALIDIWIEFNRFRANIGDADFIIGHANPIIPDAQVLDELENGMLRQDDGIVSIQMLTHNKMWIGDESNRPIETDEIPIGNLPDLEYKNIWIGDNANRPVAQQRVTTENLPSFRTLNPLQNFGVYNLYTGQGLADSPFDNPLNVGLPTTTLQIDQSNLPDLSVGKMWIGQLVQALPPVYIDDVFPYVHGQLNWGLNRPVEIGLEPGHIFIGDYDNPGQIIAAGLPEGHIFMGSNLNQIAVNGLLANQIFVGHDDNSGRMIPKTVLSFANLPDLTFKYVIIGDSSNRPHPELHILNDNLPDLFTNKLWMGDGANRPIQVDKIIQANLPDLAFKYIWIGDPTNRPSPEAIILNDNLPDLEFLYLWQGNTFDRPQAVETISVFNLPPLQYTYIWIGNVDNRPEAIQTIDLVNLPNLAIKRVWTGGAGNRPTEVTALDIDNMAALPSGQIWIGDINNRPVPNQKITNNNLPDLPYGSIWLGDLSDRPDTVRLGYKQLFIGDNANNIDVTVALYVDNLPNLTNGKYWKGDIANRPIEVDINFAPDDATYVIRYADAALPNAQILHDLSNGIAVLVSGVFETVIIEGGTGITVSQGNGVEGNPFIEISDTTVIAGTYAYATLTVNAQGQLTNAVDNGSTINNIQNNITNLGNRVTSLENRVTNVETRLTTAEGEISTLQGEVSTLQGEVATIQGEIATIEGEILTLTADVAALDFAVFDPALGLITVTAGLVLGLAALGLTVSELNAQINAPFIGIGARLTDAEVRINELKAVRYIIQTPDSAVPNAQALSTLGTGLLKNNGGGVLSIASGGSDYGTVSSVGVVGNTGVFTTGSPITSSGTITITLVDNLESLSLLSTLGFVSRIGTGTFTPRVFLNSAGLSITNNDGVSGNPSINLDIDLQGLAGLSGTGLLSRLGSGNFTERSIDGGTGINIANGNAVSGNPSVSIANTGVTAGSYSWANVTLNAQGQTTSASSNTTLPISMIQGYTGNNTKFLREDGWSDLGVTVNTPNYSIILNNLNNTGFFNDFVIQTNGNSISAFGYNPGSNETYVVAYGSSQLKFFSKGGERARFNASNNFILEGGTLLDCNNGRIINVGNGTVSTDAVNLGQLNAAVGGAGTVTSVALSTSSSGVTIGGSPITSSGTLTIDLNPQLQILSSLNSPGFTVQLATAAFIGRTLTGTANQIVVTNGSGAAGNPVFSINPNPILPGSAGVTLPSGVTPLRGGGAGTLRFNTTINLFEGTPDGSTWNQFLTNSSSLSLIGDISGSGVLGSPITTTLASSISPNGGTVLNYGNTNTYSFLDLNINNTNTTQIQFGMGQSVTTANSAYIWTYLRPVASPFQIESLVLSHKAGAVSINMFGISQGDGYVTIYNGLHMNAVPIDNVGKIGIGITNSATHAPLQFDNSLTNRKIVLYENTNNDHQFYGLGINSSALRYQVDVPTSDHVWYAGTSSTTSQELWRVKGTGDAILNSNGTLYARRPSGLISMQGNATTTTSIGGAWLKINGTTTSILLNQFTMPSNNRIQYTGSQPIIASIALNLSITDNTGTSTQIGISLYKNGAQIAHSISFNSLSAAVTFFMNISTNALVSINTNDYIEAYIKSNNSAAILTVQDMTLSITTT